MSDGDGSDAPGPRDPSTSGGDGGGDAPALGPPEPVGGRRSGDPPAVAVVGAGAVGATTARDLAAAGADVTVFERAAVAGGATGRAAGVVYDAFADPTDARVADRALVRFRAFDGRGDFSLVETPYVWLAREGDDRRAAAIREQVPRMADRGRAVELLDRGDLEAEFPAVRADDVAVAAVARDAARTEPRAYAELLASLAEREGATLRTGVEVAVLADPPRVVVGAGGGDEGGDGRGEGSAAGRREGSAAGRSEEGGVERFDAVLVAAGARTKHLLAGAGVAVPLKPYRVQALTTAAAPAVPMLYDATAGVYLRPRGAGLLAGDGTEPVEADPDDWDRTGDDWFVAAATDCLAHRVPALGPDPPVEEAWAGLCVATPDRDPLVGAVADGLFVAAGWQGHGFMRAPALGEVAAGVVLGGVRPDGGDRRSGIPAFDPGRFDGDEAFEVVEGMAVDPDVADGSSGGDG